MEIPMNRPAIREGLLSCCAVLVLLTANAMAADMPKVEDVIHRLDDLYRSSASTGHVELIAKTETLTRHLKMRIWSNWFLPFPVPWSARICWSC